MTARHSHATFELSVTILLVVSNAYVRVVTLGQVHTVEVGETYYLINLDPEKHLQ